MIQRLVIAVGVSTLVCASARGQTASGQILDPRGAPLRGASVLLLDSARAVVDTAVSDSSGAFSLNAPKRGQYVLQYSAQGFASIEGQPFQLAAGDSHQERIKLNVAPEEHVYFEFQVHQHVTPVAGNHSPAYPSALRASRVQGEVLLQFVVDTAGRPVMRTAKVLRSTHDDFTKAVLIVLPGYRFNAARLNDKPVSQLVQMPFQFSITP